ncbi:MAG: hypothetical protein MRZ75_08690 [Roseburia sp.]|nr:hypothetical protein [Roseburia sp.]
MSILSMILTGIGIVVGLIILTVLSAFLVELVKAFGQMHKDKSNRQDINNGNHRQD